MCFFSPTLAIVTEISIAPTASFHWISPRHTEAEKRNKTQGEKKGKAACWAERRMEQVQILHTKRPNREASVKHMEALVREQKYLEG